MGLDFKKAAGLEYVERVRALAPMLEAAAPEIEQHRELPESVVSALHDAQLFRMLLPRAYDGAELDLPAYVEVIEALAQADGSVAWCVAQASGCTTVAAFVKPDVAWEIFRSPHAVLAWGPPGEGSAIVVDGGYRLTGKWQFVSGIRHATWVGAHVPIREAGGKPQLSHTGAPAMRTMLFPRSAATVEDVWHVMGLKGTGSDSHSAKDLFIAHDFSAPRDHAEPLIDGPIYAQSHMVIYAASFAAISLGLARASLDAFVELARGKYSQQSDVAVCESPIVQHQIGLAETRWRAARTFLFDALRTAWNSLVTTGNIPTDEKFSQRMASTYAIGQGRDIVETVYSLAGASAIFERNAFERRFRDVHTVTQQIQGHFTHIENAGKYVLGLDYSRRYI